MTKINNPYQVAQSNNKQPAETLAVFAKAHGLSQASLKRLIEADKTIQPIFQLHHRRAYYNLAELNGWFMVNSHLVKLHKPQMRIR